MKDANIHSKDFDNQIDLLEIFYALLERKWTIVGVTSFVSIIGVIYSLQLPNIFESKALIEPVNPSSGISGALQNYSGIASLAGINIPTSSSKSNTNAAIEKIGSLSFFEDNILPNIFLPDLMAVDYWNNKTDDLIYDDSIYDHITNQWVREYSYPKKQMPTAQESFKVFKNKHLSISQDNKTYFVTLRITHQSPLIAQKWVSLLIDEVNRDSIALAKIIVSSELLLVVFGTVLFLFLCVSFFCKICAHNSFDIDCAEILLLLLLLLLKSHTFSFWDRSISSAIVIVDKSPYLS